MIMGEVTISIERFQQLIRAEQVANQLTAMIEDKEKHYGQIDHEDIRLLHLLLTGGDSE
jgi:hypothetical protein